MSPAILTHLYCDCIRLWFSLYATCNSSLLQHNSWCSAAIGRDILSLCNSHSTQQCFTILITTSKDTFQGPIYLILCCRGGLPAISNIAVNSKYLLSNFTCCWCFSLTCIHTDLSTKIAVSHGTAVDYKRRHVLSVASISSFSILSAALAIGIYDWHRYALHGKLTPACCWQKLQLQIWDRPCLWSANHVVQAKDCCVLNDVLCRACLVVRRVVTTI